MTPSSASHGAISTRQEPLGDVVAPYFPLRQARGGAEPRSWPLARALFRRGRRGHVLADRWFLAISFSAVAGMYAWLAQQLYFNALGPRLILGALALFVPHAVACVALAMLDHTAKSGQGDELRLTRWSDRTILLAHLRAATWRVASAIVPLVAFAGSMALLEAVAGDQDRRIFSNTGQHWISVEHVPAVGLLAASALVWALAGCAAVRWAVAPRYEVKPFTARRLPAVFTLIAATQLFALLASLPFLWAYQSRSLGRLVFVDGELNALSAVLYGGGIAWIVALVASSPGARRVIAKAWRILAAAWRAMGQAFRETPFDEGLWRVPAGRPGGGTTADPQRIGAPISSLRRRRPRGGFGA